MLNQKAKYYLNTSYLLFIFLSTLTLPTHFKFFEVSQVKQQQPKQCGTSSPERGCLLVTSPAAPCQRAEQPLQTQSLSPVLKGNLQGHPQAGLRLYFLYNQTIETNFPENICNHWANSILQLHDGESLHLTLHNPEGRRLLSSKLCNRNYVKTTHLLLLISLHTDLQHPTSKVKCSSSRSIFK